MRVGLLVLPAQTWRETARAWRTAEELGFDHAWVHDHVVWRDLAGRPWFAAMPTLAAAAATTSRIRLGTLVSTPNHRHPVVLAQEAVALDDISGGRMVLGLGAGVDGPDSRVLGAAQPDRDTRVTRFAEFTELTDRLLRQDVTDFDGAHYRAERAWLAPGCVQRPRLPLAIAAPSPRTMCVAARHADIWVTTGSSRQPGLRAAVVDAATVRDQAKRFTEACLAEGRDPAEPARLVYHANRDRPALSSASGFADLAAEYAAAGMTDLVVPFPRAVAPYAADPAVLDRIAADILPDLRRQ